MGVTMRFVVLTGAALILLTGSAIAHHSFAAQYDINQPVELTGAVTKVEWNNPHVYFYIDVLDEESGRIENWAWEMGAPAVIQRSGWTRNSMKIGDLVTVEGSRAKNGDTHGNARSVVLVRTGERLGAGSSQNATP